MPDRTEYLNGLESAILLKHGCRPTHRKTDFVRLLTRDKETVWEGYVETFELIGHEAKSCYVWQHTDSNGNVKIFAVLGNNLIQSPEKAVQAAIFADVQPAVREFTDSIESLKRQLEEYKRLIGKMGVISEDLNATINSAKVIAENPKPRLRPGS
ncbi:MAG TPA: hypothetical protein VMF08_08680 [Candidatus Sulfotelmatobacter sp.]|nr:hypothetical protein [Candidatus Sulfotelmatobacter sp.]